MPWFPIDTVPMAYINGDGFYEIDFNFGNNDHVLHWIALLGPPGSSVSVYLDTTFIDTTPRGDRNRADYFKGIPIARGRQLRLVWNVGAGSLPIPTASIGTDDGIDATQEISNNGSIFTNRSS